MGLDENNWEATIWPMENDITPEQVRAAATRSHLRLNQFLRQAGVASSTFYRWEEGDSCLHAVNRQKLVDALVALKKERMA